MDNRPLIKWYAEKLHALLLQDPNNPITAEIAVKLGAILNSLPYKNVEAKSPIE